MHSKKSSLFLFLFVPLLLVSCGGSNGIGTNQAPTADTINISTDESTPVEVILKGSDPENTLQHTETINKKRSPLNQIYKI